MKGREGSGGKKTRLIVFLGGAVHNMLTAPSFGKREGARGERRDISKEAERKNQTRICNGIKDLQFHLGNRHKGAFSDRFRVPHPEYRVRTRTWGHRN